MPVEKTRLCLDVLIMIISEEFIAMSTTTTYTVFSNNIVGPLCKFAAVLICTYK